MRLIYCNQVDLTEMTGQGTHENEISNFLLSDKSVEGFYVGQKPNYVHRYDREKNVFFLSIKKSLLGYIMYQVKMFNVLRRLVACPSTVLFVRYAPAMFAPLLISVLFKVPMVVRTGPTLRNLTVYKKKTNYLTKKIIYVLSKWHYLRARKILVVTNTIANYLVSTYGISRKKIIISINGCNPDVFKIEERAKVSHDAKNIETAEKLVTFAGYFGVDTGVDDFVDAMIKLCKTQTGLKAVLIGDGPIKKPLMEKCIKMSLSQSIIFMGRIKQTDLNKILNLSDLSVLPVNIKGLTETGSAAVKCYEYLAAGVPVLATRHPDHQFLEDNNLGFLCEPDSPSNMASMISKILSLPARRPQERQLLRDFALRNGTWKAAYLRLRNVCKLSI